MCGTWDGLASLGPRTISPPGASLTWQPQSKQASCPVTQGGKNECSKKARRKQRGLSSSSLGSNVASLPPYSPSFWLCWVFTAALGLSLVTAPRLQSMGSGVVAHRLSCPEVCGIVPDQGRNLSSALVHQGSPSTRAHPSSRGGDTDPLSGRDVKSFVAMFPNHHRRRCKKLQNLSTHHEGIA